MAVVLCVCLAASCAFAEQTLRERFQKRLEQRTQHKAQIQEIQQAKKNDTEPESEEKSMLVNGSRRSYAIHVPASYDGKTPMPLVVVLHGGGAPTGSAERMSGMTPKADKEGFIVVYPNGIGILPGKFMTWNAWNCCGAAQKRKVDDVGFIRTLIDELEKEYTIDPKRIYATGLSNGAIMSYRLACELSDKFAAVAPVAGALNIENPNPTDPVSVIIFHGTADQHVLYEGGEPKQSWQRDADPTAARVDKPVSYAVSYWVKHDECSPQPKREESGSIIHETYAGGRDGSGVEVYTIKGQGHAWPGGKNGLYYANVDPPTQEISATDLMWDFFARHPKTKG